MKTLIILLLVSSSLFILTFASYQTELGLRRDLFTTNYSKEIRPVKNRFTTTNVSLSVYPKALKSFNEMNGILEIAVAITLEWDDEILQWNPKDYDDIPVVKFPVSTVWIPELCIMNSANKFKLEVDEDNTLDVIFTFNGHAFLEIGVLDSTLCSPNSKNFPFDVHNCSLQLTSLLSTSEIMLFSKRLDTNYLDENPLWKISSVKLTDAVNTIRDEKVPFSYVEIILNRRPQFVLVNIYCPFLFLAIMNLAVFLLPIESGERVSFSVTILLSFTVFVTLVTEKMPQTSLSISFCSIYMLTIIAYSGGISLSVIYITSIFYTQEETKSLSAGIRCLMKIFNTSCASKNSASDTVKKEDAPVNNKACDVEQRRKSFIVTTECDDTNRRFSFMTFANDDNMRQLAKKLDRVCLHFFGIFLLAMTVLFMCILALYK